MTTNLKPMCPARDPIDRAIRVVCERAEWEALQREIQQQVRDAYWEEAEKQFGREFVREWREATDAR